MEEYQMTMLREVANVHEFAELWRQVGNPIQTSLVFFLKDTGCDSELLESLIDKEIVLKDSSGFSLSIRLQEQYWMYYTIEEALELLKQQFKEVKKINRSSFADFYTVTHRFSRKYAIKDFRDDSEIQNEFSDGQDKLLKQLAIEYGLVHFEKFPACRGTKTCQLRSDFEKQEILPMIAADLIRMKTFDEVKRYFNHHMFFCGKRSYGAPYPENRVFLPNHLLIASLAEADDEDTVAFLMDYAGIGFKANGATDKKVLYPKGWSYERYMSSLSMLEIGHIVDDYHKKDKGLNQMDFEEEVEWN